VKHLVCDLAAVVSGQCTGLDGWMETRVQRGALVEASRDSIITVFMAPGTRVPSAKKMVGVALTLIFCY